MADIRPVTENFAVAPQLSARDMREAADLGYRLIINNRPDGEAEDQPTSAEMVAAASEAGLNYLYLPVRGAPTSGTVEAVYDAISGADGPVLAFCRSGTRSIVTWALGQQMRGDRSREELIGKGRDAGYDLSGVLNG